MRAAGALVVAFTASLLLIEAPALAATLQCSAAGDPGDGSTVRVDTEHSSISEDARSVVCNYKVTSPGKHGRESGLAISLERACGPSTREAWDSKTKDPRKSE